MPVPDGRMRGIRSIRERVFYLGESAAGPNRPFAAINRRPPVTLQSTHEAALDVVDLAGLKRRALELT